jgi:phosphoglycolate phosphatase
MIKLIIFDLDGTLLNTLNDLADCTNYVLKKNGFPTHHVDAYKYFVGNGVDMLLRRALPKDVTKNFYSNIFNDFMAYYEIHKADNTAPYIGIVETLEFLQEKGILLAVATNKPHELLPELMQHYFPTINWVAVIGNRTDVPIKPNPQIVFDILNSINKEHHIPIEKYEILYVGDTSVDMETAQNAGIKSVGVLWGFRTKEELFEAGAVFCINKPKELTNFIFLPQILE